MEDNNHKFNTISAIVEQCLNDMGENSMNRYQQFLSWALWGLREWHLDSARSVKTRKITMTPYKAIDLPEDYVDWTKVGIQIGDYVKTLGVNDDMPRLNKFDECGNELANNTSGLLLHPNGTNLDNYGGYYFTGYNGTKVFAHGGGINYKGYFTEIKERRQIQFTSEVPTVEIYLEYISDGFDPNSETLVHPYVADAIKKYIHFERVNNNDKIALSQKQDKERQYEQAVVKARIRNFMSDFTPKDVLNSTRKYYRLSQKA